MRISEFNCADKKQRKTFFKKNTVVLAWTLAAAIMAAVARKTFMKCSVSGCDKNTRIAPELGFFYIPKDNR